jgi:hypothetical protein
LLNIQIPSFDIHLNHGSLRKNQITVRNQLVIIQFFHETWHSTSQPNGCLVGIKNFTKLLPGFLRLIPMVFKHSNTWFWYIYLTLILKIVKESNNYSESCWFFSNFFMKLNNPHHNQMNQIQFWTGIKILTKPPLDIKLVPKVHNCDFQTFKCLCGLKTCPMCCKTWLGF